MRLKSDVKFGSAAMAVMVAMMVVKSVYDSHNIEFVITSINDSAHMVGSMHYIDQAFDVRTKNIPTRGLKIQMHAEIRERLTQDFDVILEKIGGANEHLHIEYQKKII